MKKRIRLSSNIIIAFLALPTWETTPFVLKYRKEKIAAEIHEINFVDVLVVIVIDLIHHLTVCIKRIAAISLHHKQFNHKVNVSLFDVTYLVEGHKLCPIDFCFSRSNLPRKAVYSITPKGPLPLSSWYIHLQVDLMANIQSGRWEKLSISQLTLKLGANLIP